MATLGTQLSLSDDALRALIESATSRRVANLARDPWPYYSSAMMESIDVTWADGSRDSLLAKQSSAGQHNATSVRPEFLIHPLREPTCYRIVSDLGLDTPAYFGFDTNQHVLLIEKVDGIPLWQVGDIHVWCEAARWLARFHSRAPDIPAQSDGVLLKYDEPFYRRWIERAEQFASAENRDAVHRIASVYRSIVPKLLELPVRLIHGEFVASNILVQSTSTGHCIRVVDWEMASLGPAMMDLADLTAGDWPDADKQRMIDAYAALASAYSPDDLPLCRFARAVQWLGWSEGWKAPAEHAHDWLAEAMELMSRFE
jgi:hypothetical protein